LAAVAAVAEVSFYQRLGSEIVMVEYSEPTIVSSDTPNPLRDSILSANTNYRLSSVTPISSNTGTNHISSQNLVSPDTQVCFTVNYNFYPKR